MREAAAPVSMLFGQDVARCAFSKDWRPRAAAIRHMAAKFKELLAQLRDATGDADASSATTEPIVGQLVALQVVNLCRNQLRALPECFGKLAALRRWYLDQNSQKCSP